MNQTQINNYKQLIINGISELYDKLNMVEYDDINLSNEKIFNFISNGLTKLNDALYYSKEENYNESIYRMNQFNPNYIKDTEFINKFNNVIKYLKQLQNI